MHKIIKGLTYNKNANGFAAIFLHYSADPDKSAEWADKLKPGYASIDAWNQEMELDFTKVQGSRVYPMFSAERNGGNFIPEVNKPIWRGWDFGFVHPACVWAQLTTLGELHVLAELMGEDETIMSFAPRVLKLSKERFPGFKFEDAGDPAVTARTDKSKRTTADILRGNYNVRIQYRKTFIDEGIGLIRNLMLPKILKDGSEFVRFKVDYSCAILHEGFLGGYITDNNDKPVKDFYYEHIMDALRYLIQILFNSKTIDPMVFYPIYKPVRESANVTTGY